MSTRELTGGPILDTKTVLASPSNWSTQISFGIHLAGPFFPGPIFP